MRTLFVAAALALHGVIHLIGFVVPWGIAAVDGFPARTTALGGALVLGDTGARAVGVLWLVAAVAFVVAALAAWRRRSWTPALCLAAAIGSSVLCALALPDAAAGLVVNVGVAASAVWTMSGAGARAGGGRITGTTGVVR
jgi:hypothetical protein